MITIDPKFVQEAPMATSAMAKKPDAIDMIVYKGRRYNYSVVAGSVRFQGHDYAVLSVDSIEVGDSRPRGLKAAGMVYATGKAAFSDTAEAENRPGYQVYTLRRQKYVELPDREGVGFPMVRQE